ncbi:blood stage antigen 41-3 precursor, putative [Babesia ovis]|uniref:Blood stage antigen 41-3, putative n=1 Tax=Babesia ovis TaxID=5869 RepID=A0A9W5TAC5_BABOV|nr:blood stage antigen 41-3 precursor, putative [Babesia ovis]
MLNHFTGAICRRQVEYWLSVVARINGRTTVLPCLAIKHERLYVTASGKTHLENGIPSTNDFLKKQMVDVKVRDHVCENGSINKHTTVSYRQDTQTDSKCQVELTNVATLLNRIGADEDGTQLESLYSTLKSLLDNGKSIQLNEANIITRMVAKVGGDHRLLTLKIMFLTLLAYQGTVTRDILQRITNIIDDVRQWSTPDEQLEMINIFDSIRLYHPCALEKLQPRHRAYMEYLNEMAHNIMIEVPHEMDSRSIQAIRSTLDALDVRHYAAISGHLYLPVVIQDTQLAIEVVAEQDLQCTSIKGAHPLKMRKALLDELGWKMKWIGQEQWEMNKTDEDRANYLSKIIAYMYMDAQFIYKPTYLPQVYAEWDTDFVEDANTIPSIEIKLAPPQNPLPQVAHAIDKLEARRIQMEEGMMAKLEDKFNETLVDSRESIKQIINQQLAIFNNSELKASILSTLDNNKKRYKKTHEHDQAPSFLQLGEGVVPSSVRVMMGDVDIPDPIIKTKMEEIEQSRSYEEIQTFHQQSDELEQLTNVTLIELERALKIQLQPYIAQIEMSMSSHSTSAEPAVSHVQKAPVFLQTNAFALPNTKQLNVKIGQSEDPYPTVEDYVMNMEKKRDAAERNEKNTVLAMYLKLVKAQHEMIRDELRAATSNIISQYGGIIDESTKQEIRGHTHK